MMMRKYVNALQMALGKFATIKRIKPTYLSG